MSDKITIQLTPHNAICILSFLCEFFTDENKDVPEFAAMHEALHEYETQIVNNINHEQIDDAIAEAEVNKLLGKVPNRDEEEF